MAESTLDSLACAPLADVARDSVNSFFHNSNLYAASLVSCKCCIETASHQTRPSPRPSLFMSLLLLLLFRAYSGKKASTRDLLQKGKLRASDKQHCKLPTSPVELRNVVQKKNRKGKRRGGRSINMATLNKGNSCKEEKEKGKHVTHRKCQSSGVAHLCSINHPFRTSARGQSSTYGHYSRPQRQKTRSP